METRTTRITTVYPLPKELATQHQRQAAEPPQPPYLRLPEERQPLSHPVKQLNLQHQQRPPLQKRVALHCLLRLAQYEVSLGLQA